jgi:DNA-binding MarR family transcriptional regulator
MSGLTTGAITHILDRLEKRKFIERVRDTSDRRKIFIRIRPQSLEAMIPKYERVGKSYRSLAEDYNDKELELICDYMERACEIAEQELRKIIVTNRAGVMPL